MSDYVQLPELLKVTGHGVSAISGTLTVTDAADDSLATIYADETGASTLSTDGTATWQQGQPVGWVLAGHDYHLVDGQGGTHFFAAIKASADTTGLASRMDDAESRLDTDDSRLGVVESSVAVVKEAALNPMDDEFGGKGDGTDDLVALNAVVTKAKTATAGAQIILPDRLFGLSAPWKIDIDNISIAGPGRGSPLGGSSPNPAYGGAVLKPLAGFVGSAVLDVSQGGTQDHALAGVDLRHFAIDGFNLPAGVDGIHYMAQRSVIEDVTVARVTGRGVYFEAVDQVTTFPKGAFDLHVRGLIVVGKSTPAGEHGIEVSPGATDLIFDGLIVRSIASGFYGVYDRGSGNQYNGGIVELCQDWGFNIENARNHKLGGGLRIIETHGGVLLGATFDEQTGAWSMNGVTFRNCSEGGDNVRDGIMVDPGSHVMRGGTIGDVDFSTVTRNTSNGRRMRYGINIASANAQDVRIGAWSESYTNPPATSCFGTDGINDSGTRTIIAPWRTSAGYTREKLANGTLRVSGAGTPEGAVTAPVGSTFMRSDGGAGTCFYVKESGTGNTGWVAK